MSEYKRGMIIAVILALFLVALLGGASYYLLPPEPLLSPIPTVTPSPTPTPTPISMPTPLGPNIRVGVEVASLEGFSYTEMGYGFPETVLVLRQGTSGNITLTIYSLDGESHNVSLGLSVAGMNKELEGVNYRFYPSTLELSPKGRANSTLILEADLDAPNGLYIPMLIIYVEGDFRYETSLDSYILVFPHAPAYIFHIIAQTPELPTSPPPPTKGATPPPLPTPVSTPPPSEPWEPEIQVERGGEVYIIFYIYTEIDDPSLTLNITYQSDALPAGINANITEEPLKAVQNPFRNRSLLLTLKTDSDTPEGIYEITAKGSVGQIIYERVLHLKVTGQ